MEFNETEIKDLFVILPNVIKDNRGWFLESYKSTIFKQNGIDIKFIQDNHSFSSQKGILRGMHFQNYPHAQTKLIRCTKGSIWDVVIDLRKSSQSYLKWFGIELSEENHKMLLIPQGFAHGFLTLKDNTEVQYKVDNFYNKFSDRSIKYSDPMIGIRWPLMDFKLSDKDRNAPLIIDSDVNF